MRQVDVRVTSPAARYQTIAHVAPRPAELLERGLMFAILCAFWGIILFYALLSAV